MSSPLFRELFGARREEIWRQLAAEIGADYIDGGFWKGDKVQASHGQWQITLEVVALGKTQATRLRAPYINPDGFRFTVYRKGIFSDLGKMLGMQDVTVGHADFDRDFVIQGTDEAKLRQIFGNARIRELITAQPRINFTVKEAPGIFTRDLFADQPPEDVNALEFLVVGILKNKEQLRLSSTCSRKHSRSFAKWAPRMKRSLNLDTGDRRLHHFTRAIRAIGVTLYDPRPALWITTAPTAEKKRLVFMQAEEGSGLRHINRH